MFAARRAALYAQAQRQFVRDVPWLPLAHINETYVMSSRLRGRLLDALDRLRFDGLSLAGQPD